MIFYRLLIISPSSLVVFALHHVKAPAYSELINLLIAIEEIEKHIIEIAFEKGFCKST